METHEIKKVKPDRNGVVEFSNYLVHVAHQVIKIDNPLLSGFIQYHYEKILEKISGKAIATLFKRRSHASVQFSYPEVITLSVIFKNVPPDGYVLVIEQKILDGLTLQ